MQKAPSNVESNKFDSVYSTIWNIFVWSINLNKFLKNRMCSNSINKFDEKQPIKIQISACEEKIKQEVG